MAIILRRASILPAYFTESDLLIYDLLGQTLAYSPRLSWLDNHHLEIENPKLNPKDKMAFYPFVDNVTVSIKK